MKREIDSLCFFDNLNLKLVRTKWPRKIIFLVNGRICQKQLLSGLESFNLIIDFCNYGCK